MITRIGDDTMNIFTQLKIAFAGLAAAFSAAIGGIDMIVIGLGAAVVMDFITGITASIAEKSLSSSVGAKGIVKKFCIILIVGVVMVIDEMAGASHVLRDAVCIFYITNEGMSIIENLGRAGVPIPSFITKFFEKLKETTDSKNAAAEKATSWEDTEAGIMATQLKKNLERAPVVIKPIEGNADVFADAEAEADNAGDIDINDGE